MSSPCVAPAAAEGLKMTISLKQRSPFYFLRPESAVPANETTGATNLMAAKGLQQSYQKMTSMNTTGLPIQ
jgi:hypothetical protein